MKLLDGIRALAWQNAADGALARFLAELGATVTRVDAPLRAADLAHGDYLLENVGLVRIGETGLSRAQIEAANPRLIHVSVSTFGSGGPRRDWRGSELVASATGGILRLVGDVDRAPVKEALDACGFHADMVAAVGALAALAERRRTGLGQHVDISTQEVAFSRNINGVLVWQFDQRLLQRAGGALNYGRATVRCIWALRDGFCFHSLMTGRFGAPANQALSDWMDACGAGNPLAGVNWERYDRSTLDPETRARWEAAIEAFFRTRTRDEIANEGQRRGINATVVATPADVRDDGHLAARGFWRETPRGREPGRFVTVTRAAQPALPREPRAAVVARGPLSGIRVLDFSWALVGSITTKTLGDLGAEVIKVESRTRPCLSRLDVQVSASQPGNFDDKPWFAHLNTSKRSLALDLKQRESRELLDPLIDWADVVVENFSPGTLEKLGLDYTRLAVRNPGIVMVSGSVYGQSGPLAKSWGVDGTGAALSGRTFLTGWPDRNPVIPSAAPYGDVVLPFAMAAAVIAALEHRALRQRGCHIDASMYEVCVQQMRDAIIADEVAARAGNSDPRVFHQGVYAAQGADRWLAVTFETAQHWQAFARAECPDAQGAKPAAALARWCSARTDGAAAERLQQLGVAAGVVQDMSDLMERDSQLQARRPLVPLPHPLLGDFGHMRTPIDFSRSSFTPFRAPRMGEHSREVAVEICGLPLERYAALEKLGVFR